MRLFARRCGGTGSAAVARSSRWVTPSGARASRTACRTSTVARASSRARCVGLAGEPTKDASVPSRWLGTSERPQALRARARVSSTRGSSHASASARAAPRRWPTSKRALCATRTVPGADRPAHRRKEARASPTGGAPATMAFVMPVRTVICAGIAVPGLTRVENSPSAPSVTPPRTRTAPISVIARAPGAPPVVSRSTTTKVTSRRGVPMSSKDACVPAGASKPGGLSRGRAGEAEETAVGAPDAPLGRLTGAWSTTVRG